MINLKDIEEEALEVNRRYNSYLQLRGQHRKKVMDLLDPSDDAKELRELSRILLMTIRKEEG